MTQVFRSDYLEIEQSSIERGGFIASSSMSNDIQSMQGKRVSPTNAFVPFSKAEIEQSVASRFEQQVIRHPEHLAIKDRTGQLTYQQLNQFANRIARSILSKRGIEEEPIVLLFEQGINFLASIFGVLKTGKCYVPIDPSFPEARNSYILENSQSDLIVTNSVNYNVAVGLVNSVKRNCDILNIDEMAPDLSPENLELSVSPNALAYIIYTSGSTGKPKGVYQNNRNLLHNCMNQTNAFHLGVGDRMPLVHSCSVMGAVRVIYNALLNGVSLYPLDVKTEGLEALRSLLSSEKITVFHSVATLFRHFADIFTDSDQFPDLRLVILGGEAMSRKDVELYKRRFPNNCLLCTGLGSTEAGTIRIFMLNKQSGIESSLVPPGYAVEDLDVLLLDEAGNPVVAGEVGEIVVKSEYLALGYWHNPALTQSAFLADPEGSSARLLKTGDMGYLLPDGCLVHAGRKDFQVKIRGYRVNVSEIEMALLDFGVIKEAVVVGREDSPGEMYLTAYIVPRQEVGPTVSELRNFIAKKLPDYMIPSHFMILDALPQTANGKVDRRALPKPDSAALRLTDYVAPSNSLEQQLAEIWVEVLKLERVGTHDNFFELGGHSLLATQVISQIREHLAMELPLRTLFEKPTVAEVAADISQFQSENTGDGKEETSLEQNLINKYYQGNVPKRHTIPQKINSDVIPLSFSQQRLWFLDQLEPNSSFYNIPAAFRLSGNLNIQVLQQALDAIVAYHEVLRTTYRTENGNPVQVINSPRPVELQVIDLQSYEAAEQQSQVQQRLQQESQRPFNLASDLMLRGCVLQLSTQEYIVLLVMHHIASDGWSMRILREQLTQLYQSLLEGKPNPLEKLPIQYADYAVWQRQWLSGENLDKQLNYWKQQLAGANPVLELPSDRPRPAVQTFRGASQSFIISPTLSQSLKVLCRQERVTLYMTLLAAFQTLLYRYSGQTDILVGSPIAGRNHSEVVDLIGFFVNTLVLRSDLSGSPSFRALLKRVRQVAVGAYEHQALSFEKLVEELQPERSLSYNPLFQVMFVLQNVPKSAPPLANLNVQLEPVGNATAKFDLTLSMVESADGLRGEFEYSTDLFDAATIERMAGHFQTLLKGIVANPDEPIATLPLLTEAERHQLLVEWNNTQTDYPQDKCIHQLFEEQVERTPDAIAVVFQDQQLTYRELNDRANQLAHYLIKLGVEPDGLVGVCVERSLEMVVCLLGVLKAGGAYVPIDPNYPKERLAYIIEDTHLSIILTQQTFDEWLTTTGIQKASIDTDWNSIAKQSKENPRSKVTSDNLAYIIHTSGSTGKPKGVQICHRATVNFLHSMKRKPGLTEQDVLLAITTISFDIAVLELYLPLLVGARVVLATRAVAADASQLTTLLKQSGATVMQATPATWHMLVSEGWQGDHRLKILCGGEAMSRELADQLLARSGSLWNMYGPTETTVWSAACKVTSGEGSIAVAEPIANTQLYVLKTASLPEGDTVSLLPIGVPGEVHIGGEGLSRGYLNRPELTQERFIKDPFSTKPGARLYKTGDLARFRPDGSLEFLGRIDHQVKIRGFRIELGEIEAVLSQHPAVQQCVVIARGDDPGDKRLVAYLVAATAEFPTSARLRQFLQKALPDYMIPSAFVELEQFPLTPNGKVDRRALPKPEVSDMQSASAYVAPRTPMEENLADIWSKVLQLKQVGIHDNFFELGGHSLLAIKLLSEIESKTGLKIPLNQLLSTPTIEAIVRQLSGYKSPSLPSCIVPLKSGQDNPPFFLIHGGGAGLLFYQALIENLQTKRAVYGIKSLFLDDLNAPIDSVEEMAAYYLEQMRVIQPQGPYLIGGFCFGGRVAYEIAQQLSRQGEKIGALILIEVFAPGGLILPSWHQRYQKYWQSFLKTGLSYLTNKLKSRLAFELNKARRWTAQKKESLLYKELSLPVNDQELYLKFQAREIFRLHSVLNSKYCLRTYQGSVFLLTASDAVHQNITGENLDCSDLLTRREDLGWSQYVQGDIRVLSSPGDHDSMLQVPHVQVLAERLDSILEDDFVN